MTSQAILAKHIVQAVERDWDHLVDTLRITDSPQYLRHHGRPCARNMGPRIPRSGADTPDRPPSSSTFSRTIRIRGIA